jgi:hypothetical protein
MGELAPLGYASAGRLAQLQPTPNCSGRFGDEPPAQLVAVCGICDDWEQSGTNRIRPRGRIYADDWEQSGTNRIRPRGRIYADDWEQEVTTGIRPRGRIFADDWEQASHNGDLVHTVEAGLLRRGDVAQLGDVLIGKAEGRQTDQDITIFDSTGLAIQDLGIALAAMKRAEELDLQTIDL